MSKLNSYKYYDYLLVWTFKPSFAGYKGKTFKQFNMSGVPFFLCCWENVMNSKLFKHGRLVARQATYTGV